MAAIIAPRGTNDFLPEEAVVLSYVENAMRRVASSFGYDELRTPIFEHTELFQRGIGDTTDIVEKEMYTFTDRGDRSLTLRPEGTASFVRAYIEHKLYNRTQPVKLAYIGPMFRYERPQAGRYRQFHQLGIESLGSGEASVDAEIISICDAFYKEVGLSGYHAQLNSIGCPNCRPAYIQALRDFAESKLDGMCNSCKGRYDRNTLRLLDCKVKECKELTEGAPKTTDYLCPECSEHFEQVKRYLGALGIPFVINPRLVRGLDYYTKTVFEFTLPGIGSQDAIGAGGRYDGLIAEIGGDPAPAVGVAIGLERIVLAMKQVGVDLPSVPKARVFVATLGEAARTIGFSLSDSLRRAGIRTEMDYSGKGLKAQFKAADKLGAVVTAIIGDAEIDKGVAVVRDMASGDQTEVDISGTCKHIQDILGRR